MSGGVAYVYDPDDTFAGKVNAEMVELESLDADDIAFLRGAVQAHSDYTESAVAAAVLRGWVTEMPKFKKVMPRDYSRVLRVMKQAAADGLDEAATLDRVMEAARG
jgi:glutamate synthase (NADPH/NADH) large chain